MKYKKIPAIGIILCIGALFCLGFFTETTPTVYPDIYSAIITKIGGLGMIVFGIWAAILLLLPEKK